MIYLCYNLEGCDLPSLTNDIHVGTNRAHFNALYTL
jgi:hypothetical protein